MLSRNGSRGGENSPRSVSAGSERGRLPPAAPHPAASSRSPCPFTNPRGHVAAHLGFSFPRRLREDVNPRPPFLSPPGRGRFTRHPHFGRSGLHVPSALPFLSASLTSQSISSTAPRHCRRGSLTLPAGRAGRPTRSTSLLSISALTARAWMDTGHGAPSPPQCPSPSSEADSPAPGSPHVEVSQSPDLGPLVSTPHPGCPLPPLKAIQTPVIPASAPPALLSLLNPGPITPSPAHGAT